MQLAVTHACVRLRFLNLIVLSPTDETLMTDGVNLNHSSDRTVNYDNGKFKLIIEVTTIMEHPLLDCSFRTSYCLFPYFLFITLFYI